MFYTELIIILFALGIIFEWKLLKTVYFKGFCYVAFIDSFFTILFYLFNIEFFSLTSLIINSFIIYSLFCRIISNIRSDKINKKFVCLVFYKPKTFKQFLLSSLGLNYSSAGLIVGNKLYQMRYEAKTLQERDYTDDYIYSKYLVINTNFSIAKLKGDWKNELLQQKARQKKTLYLRYNCLRSLRIILNQTIDFKYNGEILPSIYLLRLKLKGIV